MASKMGLPWAGMAQNATPRNGDPRTTKSTIWPDILVIDKAIEQGPVLGANRHSVGPFSGRQNGPGVYGLKWPPKWAPPGREWPQNATPRNGDPGTTKSMIGLDILVVD